MIKRKVDVYVTGDFYYDCGLHLGSYFGQLPERAKHSTINKFKLYVESKGGPEKFSGAKEAVDGFIKQTKRK